MRFLPEFVGKITTTLARLIGDGARCSQCFLGSSPGIIAEISFHFCDLWIDSLPKVIGH